MHFLYLWCGYGTGTPSTDPAVLYTGKMEATTPFTLQATAPFDLEVDVL